MIGKTLGKYKIIDLLGRGGMAEVYRAYHANPDRNVALKLIKTSIADNPILARTLSARPRAQRRCAIPTSCRPMTWTSRRTGKYL